MALLDIILWIVIVISIYFAIWWIIALNKTLAEAKVFSFEEAKAYIEKNNIKLPKITIIVPLWNEEETIKGTLISILALDYPKHLLELIIINDGSKDNSEYEIFDLFKDFKTKSKIKKNLKTFTGVIRRIEIIEITEKTGLSVKYIYQPNSGKGVGINVGLSVAKGKYYACLDADSYVHHETLIKMIAVWNYLQNINNGTIAVITPAMFVYNPKTVIEHFQHYEYMMSMLASRIMSDHDMIYVTPGPFSLYNTKIIKELGGYHENQREILTEDQEIAYRIQEKHFLIKQCTNGYVYASSPKTLSELIKQRNRWFKGSIICLNRYRHIFWNKKYGDFGIQQMSINLLRIFLAFAVAYIFYELTIYPFYKMFYNMYLYGFDIKPFIDSFKWNIDFLLFNYSRLVATSTIMITGIFMLILSFINANIKIEKKDYKYIAVFYLIYHLLMAYVMIKVVYELIIGKKQWWGGKSKHG